jgi:hypothetical protein
MKYMLTTINTRWEPIQMVMSAKLTRLTHKIAIQLQLGVESCIICSSRSRWPVRKHLDTPSYMRDLNFSRQWRFERTSSGFWRRVVLWYHHMASLPRRLRVESPLTACELRHRLRICHGLKLPNRTHDVVRYPSNRGRDRINKVLILTGVQNGC